MKTYSEAGVDREQRAEAKKQLEELKSTHVSSKYGEMIETPYNTLYPVCGKYHVKTCDGVGTKVLLAQLADKHDTIGIDAIAMVVNDCIRCGAQPLALTDVIDIRQSNSALLREIEKGLNKGAQFADCPIVGGETADVPELMAAQYHINCDCVGEVEKDKIITGTQIKPGNIIIGFRSSGLHSNGISLARKVLFRQWGGAFEIFDKVLGRELILEALEPTMIYVKKFLEISRNFDVLGAVHITGDAYLKFDKIQFSNIGFEFDNFKPQPIFDLIQKTGGIETKEMFSTFNMGWGFAIIVDKEDAEGILSLVQSEIIGRVTDNERIVINHKNEKIVLK